jgi:hypothetical protein
MDQLCCDEQSLAMEPTRIFLGLADNEVASKPGEEAPAPMQQPPEPQSTQLGLDSPPRSPPRKAPPESPRAVEQVPADDRERGELLSGRKLTTAEALRRSPASPAPRGPSAYSPLPHTMRPPHRRTMSRWEEGPGGEGAEPALAASGDGATRWRREQERLSGAAALHSPGGNAEQGDGRHSPAGRGWPSQGRSPSRTAVTRALKFHDRNGGHINPEGL